MAIVPGPIRPYSERAGRVVGLFDCLGAPLTARAQFSILRRHERPKPHLRHLPGDYSLATLAGCGRLFSKLEMFGRPASKAEAHFDM
jgi:hypothetical protein